jgi:hypothetical protein
MRSSAICPSASLQPKPEKTKYPLYCEEDLYSFRACWTPDRTLSKSGRIPVVDGICPKSGTTRGSALVYRVQVPEKAGRCCVREDTLMPTIVRVRARAQVVSSCAVCGWFNECAALFVHMANLLSA